MDKEIAALESLVEELGSEHVDNVDTASFNVETLFEGEDFTPEFKEKIATIFEAAVKARVDEEVAVIQSSLTESTEMEIDSAAKGLKSLVDGYLDVLAEKWISENELALAQSLRAELFESMLAGMKNLLVEHNVVVPDGKFDAFKEMEDRATAASAKADELMEETVKLRMQIKGMEMEQIVVGLSEGLSDMQAEKFAAVARDYMTESDLDKFERKLSYIRESLFTDAPEEKEMEITELSESEKSLVVEEVVEEFANYITEDEVVPQKPAINPTVSAYAAFLNRS